MLKRIAQIIFSTINPGTKALTKRTSNPLMTKVNKPKETIFIGNVRRKRIGLMTALTIPRTIATTIAVKKL